MARRPPVLLNQPYYLYVFLDTGLNNLFLIYLSLKYLPTKIGSSASNSAKIQPKAENVLFLNMQKSATYPKYQFFHYIRSFPVIVQVP